MLIGFFKELSAQNCDVSVIGFCDRIWAEPDLSVSVFRVFSLSISPNCTGTMKRLHILMGPSVERERNANDSAIDAHLYWNAPELRTTPIYKVLKSPGSASQGDRGQIQDESLILDVFADRAMGLSKVLVAEQSLLTLEFPDDLRAGDRVQCRLRFQVPNAMQVNDIGAGKFEYVCELKYFYGSAAENAVRILGGEGTCIPVYSRPLSNQDGTGFTVVFYAPPNYHRGNGFDETTVEALDSHLEDGTDSGKSRVKLLWQLDELLEREGKDPKEPVRCSSHIRISGSLERSNNGEEIEDLKIRVLKLKSEVRWGTIIAVAGTVIAIAGIIFEIVK